MMVKVADWVTGPLEEIIGMLSANSVRVFGF